MTTLADSTVRRAPTRATLGALARIEAKRFARHPLFLVGLAFGTWVMWWIGDDAEGPSHFDVQVVPAFCVGVLGFVVAVRLTRSTGRSREVLDGAPVPATVRTGALCLACLVPLAAGLWLVGLHAALIGFSPEPAWRFGTYGPLERWVVIAVLPAVACLGAPLLGVAVGRWLRFPGAALLGVVALILAVNFAGYATMLSTPEPSVLARILHVLPPWSPVGVVDGDGTNPTTQVVTFTGSVVLYALYLLALCALAVLAALWRDAEGAARRRVGRAFVVVAAAAVVLVVAAGLGGEGRPVLTTPEGSTEPVPADAWLYG